MVKKCKTGFETDYHRYAWDMLLRIVKRDLGIQGDIDSGQLYEYLTNRELSVDIGLYNAENNEVEVAKKHIGAGSQLRRLNLRVAINRVDIDASVSDDDESDESESDDGDNYGGFPQFLFENIRIYR